LGKDRRSMLQKRSNKTRGEKANRKKKGDFNWQKVFQRGRKRRGCAIGKKKKEVRIAPEKIKRTLIKEKGSTSLPLPVKVTGT